MSDPDLPSPPIVIGPRILLRDRAPGDVDRYVHWLTHGAWREFDAPWEVAARWQTQAQRDRSAQRFLESCSPELPFPRTTAIIATHRNEALGWVNRYSRERFPDTWLVGIAVGEDEQLNRGIGTEALRLWVDYLFGNSTVHKIALRTWSFNGRMIRVAEKLGFVLEGVERELIQWQGKWVDRILFGMLRPEWEESTKRE